MKRHIGRAPYDAVMNRPMELKLIETKNNKFIGSKYFLSKYDYY